MDHPLPLAPWRFDRLDRLGLDRLDSDLDLNMQHLDVNSQPRSDEVIGDVDVDIDESSESDRLNQWIRADSTSSSRSTLLSDLSAEAGKPSPGMQWEVVGGHGHHDHGHSLDHTLDNLSHDHDDGHAHSHDQDIYPPKAEPDEYDFCLEDVQPVPPPAKRPRGRPRKPSMSSSTAGAGAATKIAKARSKTGCTTCRRRKKKCDETKPVCLNCEKNAVVCEGYKEKHVWKSGRERAEELKNQSQTQSLDITLQPIFMGMDGREDRLIWNYYLDHVSNVFTADYARDSVFRTTVVPLATTYQAMMHSVLSLASRHINFDSPHVQKLLRRSPKVTPESLQSRGSHHNSEALTRLSKDMHHSKNSFSNAQYKTPDALAARYAQMLFLVLESLAEGQHNGSQRLHYEWFLYMLNRFPPASSEFYSFISEIFYYHIYADDLLYCPLQHKARLVGDWVPAMPLGPARLLGVVDGLFNYLSQITSIRDCIRARVQSGADPRIDYDSLYRASALECQIHDWKPEWAPGDSRNRATLLYQQMAWLYLKTTVCPPQVHSFQARADDCAVQSGSTTCASSPGPMATAADMIGMIGMIPAANNFSNPRRHSIANPSLASGSRPFLPKIVSFAEVPINEDESESRETRKESPPPIRRPANHESAVAVAVKEALALLESFAPDDRCQTLLLVPCVVVGTACYAPDYQARIRTAIRTVHAYTGLRHTNLALELLERVWQLMAQGEFLGAWDWQTVAYHLGMHHLF